MVMSHERLEESGSPLLAVFPEITASALVGQAGCHRYLSSLDSTCGCPLPECCDPYPQFLDKREYHISWFSVVFSKASFK